MKSSLAQIKILKFQLKVPKGNAEQALGGSESLPVTRQHQNSLESIFWWENQNRAS